MSKTKATGTSSLGRDSIAKRLGIKRNDNQKVRVGEVLARQKGTKYLAGENTKLGGDYTIYSMVEGTVKITTVAKIGFNGQRSVKKRIAVVMNEAPRAVIKEEKPKAAAKSKAKAKVTAKAKKTTK